jgi:WD40 repeat protein
VVTASDDKTARIWDARTGEPIGEPLQHQGSVNAASFDATGERVVTASDDKTARIWKAVAAPGQPLLDRIRSMLGPRAPKPLKIPASPDRSQSYVSDFVTGVTIVWTRLGAAIS